MDGGRGGVRFRVKTAFVELVIHSHHCWLFGSSGPLLTVEVPAGVAVAVATTFAKLLQLSRVTK